MSDHYYLKIGGTEVFSEQLIADLDARSIPNQLHLLEGEGHGFRRADSLAQCLRAELNWFKLQR
jgi:dipeptidyl aminopeptidase/acylaminoacyl peptidase